jgi:hypothetical protein
MIKTFDKLADLKFNELYTLVVIERTSDLKEIFSMDVPTSFPMLYTLQKEGKLSANVTELLSEMFEKIILTKKNLVETYVRIANSNGEALVTPKPIEIVLEEPKEVEVITKVEEVLKPVKTVKKNETKEKVTPRRYGKEKILTDIKNQDGVATQLQRCMLKVNDLKNIHATLATRGVKDLVGVTNLLTDDDCRKIMTSITMLERQLSNILKKK